MDRQKITEKMILECYEAFRKGNFEHVPAGMKENSAKMTMTWLRSLFSGKPYHRDASVMQYKLILERIAEDYGNEELQRAKAVLFEHCEWSLEHHNKPRRTHRKVLDSF